MFEQLSLFEKAVDIDALIDALLHIGSHFAYSKARIFDHFTTNANPDNNAAFLKHEYGIGGHTWGFDDHDLFVDHDGRGIRCYSSSTLDHPQIRVELNWHQVAKKIRQAINCGEYITKAQYDALRSEEREEREYWIKQGLEDDNG